MSAYNDNQKTNAEIFVSKNFYSFINALEENELSELDRYIPDDKTAKSQRWNIEKAKVVLELLKKHDKYEVEKILSYIEHSNCGWYEGCYHLSNNCLRHDRRCRNFFWIDNSTTMTKETFVDINNIFLHKEYGAITTYLFGYCLVALFSSKLKREGLRIPYFLQIACERNSNIYRLIHEIVDICDVNTGLLKNCNVELDCDYGYCDSEHVTVFPSQSTNNLLENLLCHRDIPVIVDGYENEKFYSALLREIANIPGRNTKLDTKERFNILPILVCSNITSTFKNVLSVDLTSLDIDDDYMELIEKNKQMIASWTFDLVISAKEYFKQQKTIADEIHRTPEDELPLFDHISEHINCLRKKYRDNINLIVTDMTNIGYLSYFFTRFMSVFKRALQLSNEEKRECGSGCEKYILEKLINKIVSGIEDSLVEFHNKYSPMLKNKVSINTPDFDSVESNALKKRGVKYAKDIVKYYQSYGASIIILPNAEYKDDRYVFSVKLLPGTNKNAISMYADSVRRLLGIGFFFPDISPSSIKLIASEKPLKENSLRKMLESQAFRESKMQIPYAVGYDLLGEMIIADIAEFTHLLIGGASGYGKSSALHSLLMSIVCKQPADKVKLLLFDFGGSRLDMFEDIPHMLLPSKVITDVGEGLNCMLKLQEELERRLKILSSKKGKDYDKELEKLPFIICVIDEYPAFIKGLKKRKSNDEASNIIEDILSRARKVKMILVLAAQSVSKDSIAIGKTNFGAGIAFRCNDWHDSKAIIGGTDATELSGKGSMYFKCDQYGLIRLQGSFMLPEEIIDIIDKMNFTTKSVNTKYEDVQFSLDSLYNESNDNISTVAVSHDEEQIVKIVKRALKEGKISNHFIKVKFGMGFDKANTYIKQMEDYGIIPQQRKGAKLYREVNRDKANEFLQEHGYNSKTVSEDALEETSIVPLAQVDTEINRKENKEDLGEEKMQQKNEKETKDLSDTKALEQAIIELLPYLKSPKKWRNPKKKNNDQKL